MLTSEQDRFKLDPQQLWCHSQILGISGMVDVPSGLFSNLLHDLSTTHLHSSTLCCLQNINLNVFLPICKSMRLFPIIIIYFLLFMFSEEQNLVLLRGPNGLQSHSETTDASSLQYTSCLSLLSADHRRQSSHMAYFHLHFCLLFHFPSFFLLYFLSFIFISSVFAICLLIKHNFPHSKTSPHPNILNLMHLS